MKKYKFSDLFEMISGVVLELNDYSKKGFKILKIENIKNGFIDKSNCLMTETVFDNKFYTKKGDILLALNRPIVNGKLKIGQIEESGYLIFQRVGIIRKKHNNNYDDDYCFKIIKKVIENYAFKNIIGGLIPFLKNSEINDIEFFINEKDATKINNKLNNETKKIEKIKKLLEKIEIRNQYYIEKLLNGDIFITHNHNFKNMTYQKLKISEIVEKNVTSGTTPKDIKNQKTCNYSINYYKVENLNGQLEQKYYINDLEHNNMRRSQLNENDILITIAGTLGRIALVKNSDLPGNINQAIAIIRTDSNKCNNKYVYYFLKTIKDQIERNQNDGAIKNLNLTTLSNIEINLPTSISYQENIVEFLDKLTLEKEKIEKLLSLEKQRFEWLSDKLLSGEYIIED